MANNKTESTKRRRARKAATAAGKPVPKWAAVRKNTQPKRKPKPVSGGSMDATSAMALAESMGLPDGAYFAMVGELIGAGGDDAYMAGIEAELAAMD